MTSQERVNTELNGLQWVKDPIWKDWDAQSLVEGKYNLTPTVLDKDNVIFWSANYYGETFKNFGYYKDLEEAMRVCESHNNEMLKLV